jgi:hypothetical protein
MLGLRFQADAADFEAGLDAFIAALGNTAGNDSSTPERRPRRKSKRPRRRRVEAKSGGRSSEGAAASATKRLESYLASVATALGFELA